MDCRLNVLFTGRGTSGSWQCRGVQLGGRIGTVKPRAKLQDMLEHDLIVLVKRPAPGQIDAIRKSGKPWVWDVVDFYPQPECTRWDRDKAISWVRKQIRSFNPTGVVWPNAKMQADCGGGPSECVVYHHHRIDIAANPIRDNVSTVGYEGSERYLGRWGKAIKAECKARGWEFAVNKGVHADWDICVAFRDDAFNGYAQKHWKSNVKLANCHGSGTPFIGPREHGYLETLTGRELFVDSQSEISAAFDALEPVAVRRIISHDFLFSRLSIDSVVRKYSDYLRAL